VRWVAASALGQLGSAVATPEVVATLLKCLTDSDGFVRGAAASALGNLSVQVRVQERLEMANVFAVLAHSRNAEKRETGYVILRNLLAPEEVELVQA
jgi:HEAT repeat protein